MKKIMKFRSNDWAINEFIYLGKPCRLWKTTCWLPHNNHLGGQCIHERWFVSLRATWAHKGVQVCGKWLTFQGVVHVVEDIGIRKWRLAKQRALHTRRYEFMYEICLVEYCICCVQNAFWRQERGWISHGPWYIIPHYLRYMDISCEHCET